MPPRQFPDAGAADGGAARRFAVTVAAMLPPLWRWCDRPSPRRALAVGVVVGIAIAAKWVFVPCAVAAVIAIALARRFADAAACAAGVVIAFVVLNLPLITAWPRIL